MKNVLTITALSVMLLITLTHCSDEKKSVDLEKEKEAIKKVIALETEAYYKQDFDLWRTTYLDTSYFRMYGYWEGYSEKVRSFYGFNELESFKKKQFDENQTLWTGSTETRLNENFRISTDMAWYTFDQESFDKDGKFLGKSLEIRILEKHNDEWKIAMLGYHYLPFDSLRQQ
jgi:hypothetical protein